MTAVLAFAVMGLLVGIAYGSGEGEVREAYPGKLTSLDALLAGKIFSRDVSASVLLGVAAAGWLLLCQYGLGLFCANGYGWHAHGWSEYTFARLPWLSLLVGRQWQSLLIAVAGLLLPAAFLFRSKSPREAAFCLAVLFALCAVLHDGARYSNVASSLFAMGILVSALLLPFFAFDLLAAMVSLSALAFVSELVRLSAVFPSWIGFAVWLAAFAAAFAGDCHLSGNSRKPGSGRRRAAAICQEYGRTAGLAGRSAGRSRGTVATIAANSSAVAGNRIRCLLPAR